MRIIDAHHHLWAPQTPALDIGYVWLKDIGAMKPFGDPTPIQRDYLLDEFLGETEAETAGGGGARTLSASVHVQCDPRLPDPVAETAFIQNISDRSGHPIMIVAFADLAAPDFAGTLARHRAHPNLRGIRQILSHLPDRPEISFAARNLLDDPVWRDNFARLAEAGLSFDLQLYPEQMAQAADFLAQHPDIPVVVDHIGSPHDLSETGLARWAEGMAALAALPHVQAKLSGYAMFFGADLGPGPARITRDILALFGPGRVMFGSNFPVDKLHLRYPDLLDFITHHVPPEARGAVLADNAAGFYRISGC